MSILLVCTKKKLSPTRDSFRNYAKHTSKCSLWKRGKGGWGIYPPTSTLHLPWLRVAPGALTSPHFLLRREKERLGMPRKLSPSPQRLFVVLEGWVECVYTHPMPLALSSCFHSPALLCSMLDYIPMPASVFPSHVLHKEMYSADFIKDLG